MRRLGRHLGRLLLVLLLAVTATALWKREELTRLWAVNTLFTEDRIVGNFSDMGAAFLTVPVPRGDGPVSTLPDGPAIRLPPESAQWIATRRITSLLVVKDGSIRHESYYLGTRPSDRRISWSIAKSYLSALFGVLLAEGTIASLDDPVTRYAPKLAGSAYDGVSLRNALNMSSGVSFDEDYLNDKSDIKRMGRVVALGGTLDDFTAGFTHRFAAPGRTWKYVSIDTHAIGMVIRGATGRPIAELLSEKIIAPLGLERDGYYLTDGTGAAFVLGGLNMTTRDYARFGQMILQNGRYDGQQVVPADWIAAATVASAPTRPDQTGYGYFWYVPRGAHAGEFMGRGIYGQYLYIDQARGVVIVVTAADRRFRDPGVTDFDVAMLRRIADSPSGDSHEP